MIMTLWFTFSMTLTVLMIYFSIMTFWLTYIMTDLMVDLYQEHVPLVDLYNDYNFMIDH